MGKQAEIRVVTIGKQQDSQSCCLELPTLEGNICAFENFAYAVMDDGEPRMIHFVDFEVNDDELSGWEINKLKMELIRFHHKHFYNNTLYRSSPKNPDKLYKYIENVKGKDYVLVPKLTITQNKQ